jgi:hypothetical protein
MIMRKDHPLDVNTVEAIGVPDAENTLDEYIRVGSTRHQSAEKTRGRQPSAMHSVSEMR